MVTLGGILPTVHAEKHMPIAARQADVAAPLQQLERLSI
jgi:hypothetical protein